MTGNDLAAYSARELAGCLAACAVGWIVFGALIYWLVSR